LLANAPAWGESYQARDESLHTFFTALSVPLGLPVVVSRDVARKRISGVFDLAVVQQTLEAVAAQQGLIWYSDGQVLYLYDAGEAKSSAVALRHISVDKLRGFMRRSGLDESRYPLRETDGRTFYVAGPPNYVDQVLNLAQQMDRQRTEVRLGKQIFGVVQVFNTHVADRQYAMGNDKVNVPGMASIIENLLAIEQQAATQRPPSALADKSVLVIAYPDSNSLLIKGKPAQVKVIEDLVAELDKPKRAIEVSLWQVDVDRDELAGASPQSQDHGVSGDTHPGKCAGGVPGSAHVLPAQPRGQ
jgi:type III secretion protein C